MAGRRARGGEGSVSERAEDAARGGGRRWIRYSATTDRSQTSRSSRRNCWIDFIDLDRIVQEMDNQTVEHVERSELVQTSIKLDLSFVYMILS